MNLSPAFLEELSPGYVREKRIDLTLDDEAPSPAAFVPVLINVGYTRALPEGVALPLLLEVQGPSSQSYQRRVFTHATPSSLIFTPREGGRHLVVLREAAHNRWWGSLQLDVAGELLEAPRVA